MARLFTAPTHSKKHVPNIGKQRRQRSRPHVQPDDEWQRKPSMTAYYRPKLRGIIDFEADDMYDMDMDAHAA